MPTEITGRFFQALPVSNETETRIELLLLVKSNERSSEAQTEARRLMEQTLLELRTRFTFDRLEFTSVTPGNPVRIATLLQTTLSVVDLSKLLKAAGFFEGLPELLPEVLDTPGRNGEAGAPDIGDQVKVIDAGDENPPNLAGEIGTVVDHRHTRTGHTYQVQIDNARFWFAEDQLMLIE